MRQKSPLPIRHALVVALIAVALLAFAAPFAAAAEFSAAIPALLPAFDMMEICRDRTRMIQFSVVAVAFGIALLWWGNKTN